MPKIIDVAKRANTSISTVSRVLNGSAKVKKETKDRILEAIEELGYKPLTRKEEVRKTNTIGLIVPDIENPFFGKMAKAITGIANDYDYNILLLNVEGIKSEKEMLINSIEEKVDGIIYTSSYRCEEIIKKAKIDQFPIVVMDREIRNIKVNTVSVNNEYAGFVAAEHLLKLGHRKIAFIAGPESMQVSVQRQIGYERALQTHGIDVDTSLILHGDFKMESGYKTMKKLLHTNQDISAVVAANDLMAIGALNYANYKGLKVPRDISIIGFDDIELASSITPKLTSVSYPLERMGELAMQSILSQIEEKDSETEMVTLFPELKPRESAGKY